MAAAAADNLKNFFRRKKKNGKQLSIHVRVVLDHNALLMCSFIQPKCVRGWL
jgi:hypothetical protein